jgi:DNA-binding beta-propeller fold protein YncE
MTCKQKIRTGSGILLTVMVILSLGGGSSFSMGLDFGGGDTGTDPVPPPDLNDLQPGTLGSPIRGSNLNRRWLLVTDISRGNIYAVKKKNPSVTRKLFQVKGWPVATSRLGKFYIVANQETDSIEVYRRIRRQGKLRFTLNTDPVNPVDMVRHGRVFFVVDSLSNTVQVYRFQKRNSLLYSFGEGILHTPSGIALDKKGRRVFVSDSGVLGNTDFPPAIHIFSYRGEYLDTLNGQDFDIYTPKGMVYNDGTLYVTDFVSGRISAVDLASMTHQLLGEHGTKPGQLYMPMDVIVDRRTGKTFVVNYGQAKVDILP